MVKPRSNNIIFNLFLTYCNRALDPVPDMKYYSCVGLCALDAVFSIRADYLSVVSPIIDRFCNHFNLIRSAPNPDIMPEVNEQITISELRQRLVSYDADYLADVLNNHQRTSTRNGILKAQAFLSFIDILSEFQVETFQDVNRLANDNPEFERALRGIRGQKLSVDYFFMLAGDINGVKVDTHIRRFMNNAIGYDLSNEQIINLFRQGVDYYRMNGYPNMTARHLDHIVWSWQRTH